MRVLPCKSTVRVCGPASFSTSDREPTAKILPSFTATACARGIRSFIVRMGPPRRMVSGGPATNWARAGIAFAAHAMMADDAEAVPTNFRKSRRDPKASKIADNGLCITLPPLGLISQKLQQFGAFGQAGNFWLWHYRERREGGCLATIRGVSGHWAPIASAGAPQD